MNWAVWPGRYPPGDPAGGPGQKKRRGGTFYLPRRFGVVCGSQGSGHGYLAVSAYQIQARLSPCSSFASWADKLGPRGSRLALWSALHRRCRWSWSRCRRETSSPVDVLDAPAQGQKVSSSLSKWAFLDNVMRHLLARLAAALVAPVLLGINPMDSILVPHWTLWYPARLGFRSGDAARRGHFVRKGG